jgi:L-asparaginase II
MYAVIHEHNSESLKGMPHTEHIAGVNACSIHEYNSESLKGMPHKEHIAGVNACSYS